MSLTVQVPIYKWNTYPNMGPFNVMFKDQIWLTDL